MKLIVGLGNPGRKYSGTRHNIGFETLDRIAADNAAQTPRSRFEGMAAECSIGAQRALLVWPHTYMNRSGLAVGQAAAFYKTPLEDLLVVCDDFNLPLGTLRYRAQGSSGGQNGLKDIIRVLGTDAWPRLRVGVGPVPERWDAADFVLGRFGKDEVDLADSTIRRAAESVRIWAEQGVVEAMNRYN